MVLPVGTELPPLVHGVAVLLALAASTWALSRAGPRVTDATIVALAPWMATGAALYVGHEVDRYPNAVAPLFGSPTVYLTVAAVAAATWALAARLALSEARSLAAAGSLAALVAVGVVVANAGPLRVVVPLAILAGGALTAVLAWVALGRVRPGATAATGATGALVVAGHALDGVSTAVGVTALDVTERTPLSRAIIEAGNTLPTAAVVDGAWLFALVKVVLASAVVAVFADYAREDPAEARLLLALVAAVGLGPGVHNVVLFTVAAV